MPMVDETWQPARLFPITGIGGADEQERRGCSALLAVIQSVREFGRTLTMRCGAPAGVIETFIEVPFVLNDLKFRPDGLIRVTRGQKSWTALVEVKTGRNDLKVDQITNYPDIRSGTGIRLGHHDQSRSGYDSRGPSGDRRQAQTKESGSFPFVLEPNSYRGLD